MTDPLYAINDALTTLANEHCSIPPDDDTLNDLAHHVARVFGIVPTVVAPVSEIISDPNATDFSLDEVVAGLVGAGIPAYVEMTGGGVATIYAGEPVPQFGAEGEPHWNKYPVLAGPGWFEGPNYTKGTASTADFYIGPDDDGESVPIVLADHLNDSDDPVATAVRLITQAVKEAQ